MSDHTKEILTNIATIGAVGSAGVAVVGAVLSSPVVAIVGTAALGVAGLATAIGTGLKSGRESKSDSRKTQL